MGKGFRLLASSLSKTPSNKNKQNKHFHTII